MDRIEQLKQALVEAHRAGDTQAAQLFADEIRTAPSKAESFVQGVGQGASFGFADELGAGLRSQLDSKIAPGVFAARRLFSGSTPGREGQGFVERLGNLDDDFKEHRQEFYGGSMLDQYRGALDTGREAVDDAYTFNPKTAIAGTLAGGLATGAPGASKAVAGQTARQALPRLMGTGAGYGALGGAGSSTGSVASAGDGGLQFDGAGAAELAKDTLTGGAFGAALAPLPAIAANGLRRAGAKFLPQSSRGAEAGRQQVAHDVMSDLDVAGMSRKQAQELLDSNPNMTLADLGENTRMLAQNAGGAPGAAGARVRSALEDRDTASYSRIMGEAAEGLGANGRNFADAVDTLMKTTRAQADELYAEAAPTLIRLTPDMRGAFGRSNLKSLRKEAMEIATTSEGGPPPSRIAEFFDSFEQMSTPPPVTTDVMDTLLRTMNQSVTRLFKKTPELAKAVKNNMRQIQEGVYDQNQVYKQARGVFHSNKNNEEAIEAGRKVFSEEGSRLAKNFAEYSDSEKINFRVGVMSAIQKTLGNKRLTADAASDLALKPNQAHALRVAFGDMGKFRKFEKLLRDEMRMRKTHAKVQGASDTANKLSKDAEVKSGRIGSILGMLLGAKVGLPPFLAGGIAGQVGRSMGRGSQQFNQAAQTSTSNALLGNSLNVLDGPSGMTGLLTKPAMVGSQPARALGILGGIDSGG